MLDALREIWMGDPQKSKKYSIDFPWRHELFCLVGSDASINEFLRVGNKMSICSDDIVVCGTFLSYDISILAVCPGIELIELKRTVENRICGIRISDQHDVS